MLADIGGCHASRHQPAQCDKRTAGDHA
jgi:hypothetical protein